MTTRLEQVLREDSLGYDIRSVYTAAVEKPDSHRLATNAKEVLSAIRERPPKVSFVSNQGPRLRSIDDLDSREKYLVKLRKRLWSEAEDLAEELLTVAHNNFEAITKLASALYTIAVHLGDIYVERQEIKSLRSIVPNRGTSRRGYRVRYYPTLVYWSQRHNRFFDHETMVRMLKIPDIWPEDD